MWCQLLARPAKSASIPRSNLCLVRGHLQKMCISKQPANGTIVPEKTPRVGVLKVTRAQLQFRDVGKLIELANTKALFPTIRDRPMRGPQRGDTPIAYISTCRRSLLRAIEDFQFRSRSELIKIGLGPTENAADACPRRRGGARSSSPLDRGRRRGIAPKLAGEFLVHLERPR
jgi:hypothetical protein